MMVHKPKRSRRGKDVEENRSEKGVRTKIVSSPLQVNAINSRETIRGSCFIAIEEDVPEIVIANNDESFMV